MKLLEIPYYKYDCYLHSLKILIPEKISSKLYQKNRFKAGQRDSDGRNRDNFIFTVEPCADICTFIQI